MKINKLIKSFIINTILYTGIIISLILIYNNPEDKKDGEAKSKVKFIYQQF